MSKTLLCTTTLLLAGLAQAATVDVTYVEPDSYIDGGIPFLESRMVKSILTETFAELGARYLPAGQHLTIDVLDIDLAGEDRFRFRRGQEQRVLRGGADFPRISLRYTLQDGDKAPVSDKVWVSDMDYTGHGYSVFRNEPLFYERRMLERWFRQQFAPNAD